MKKITLFALMGCLLHSYLGWTQEPGKTTVPAEVVGTSVAGEDQGGRPKKERRVSYQSTRMTSDEVGTELITQPRSPDHRFGVPKRVDSRPPVGPIPRYRTDTTITNTHLPARRSGRREPKR